MHDIWVDGVFALDANSGNPRFLFTAPPTPQDVQFLADGRRADFDDALNATGMVARPKRFDYGYHWEILQYIYQPFLQAEPFTFTHEYVAKSFDTLMFNNPNKYSTAIPPDWLFVNRLQWGLNSVLAHLNATADWGALFRRALEPKLTGLERDRSVDVGDRLGGPGARHRRCGTASQLPTAPGPLPLRMLPCHTLSLGEREYEQNEQSGSLDLRLVGMRGRWLRGRR